MAEVRTARRTNRFGSGDPELQVPLLADRTLRYRDAKRRPAGSRVELGIAVEQRIVAHDAVVRAFGLGVVVLAGEGSFGARLLGHVELLVGQTFLELVLVKGLFVLDFFAAIGQLVYLITDTHGCNVAHR